MTERCDFSDPHGHVRCELLLGHAGPHQVTLTFEQFKLVETDIRLERLQEGR